MELECKWAKDQFISNEQYARQLITIKFIYPEFYETAFYKRAAQLLKYSRNELIYIFMSNIFQTGAPPAKCNPDVTQALLEACPILKTVLTCLPNQIFSHILALSKLTHEEQQPFRKYKPTKVEVNDPLIEQFKKVTEWNIDHLDLFNQLSKISESIRLDIGKLYGKVLIEKVNHGLHMLQIMSKLPPRARMNEKGLAMTKEIKKSYEAIKGYSGNLAETNIYTQRFMVLNEEQRLRYKIKLMKNLPNLPENEVLKMYQLLETSEYQWLLQELQDIDCPKSMEYKGILSSLKLVVENEKVILSNHPKISHTFINNQLLNSCMRQFETSALSFGEVLEHNYQIYLKFDITEIQTDIIHFIQSIAQQNGIFLRVRHPSIDRSNTENVFQEILKNLKSIIQAILEMRQIFFYTHNQQFDQITGEKIGNTLLICLEVLKLVVSFAGKIQIIQVIDKYLINPETIKLFNQIICFFSSLSKAENQQKAFLIICQIIQFLVMKNAQKIAIMNNPQFLRIFVETTNKIINGQDTIYIPEALQQFLIQYVQNLFGFGLNASQINLSRLYQLKLKSLQNKQEDKQRKMFVQMRMIMNRFERDKEDGTRGCKLEDFISTFPESIEFFSDKLITSINSLSKELDQIDIFGDNCPQNFKYVLNLFANQKLKTSPDIESAILDIIRKHSTFFMKYAEGIDWKSLNKRLNISEDFVFHQLMYILEDLRSNLVIKSIHPEELCEKFTSTNRQLINQIKQINYINSLLKMKKNNPALSFVKQIVELSLLMEQIESISLNKIVKYQAEYSPEKLIQLKQLYKTNNGAVLHFKLEKDSSQLALTCWQIFSQLDIQHVNTFLKHYRMYFDAMKDITDRNLILRLIKKTYRNIGYISKGKKQNFSLQLYYHNSDIINEVIEICLASIKTKEEIPEQNVVMGKSYLNFVDKCNKQGKNACTQYNKIIIPHISSQIKSFYRFILNGPRSQMVIFGNKSYSGQKNVKRVIKAVTADMIQRISSRFSLETLDECLDFISTSQNLLRRFVMRNDILQEMILEINLTQQDFELNETKVSQQTITKCYIDILRKIQQERYNQTHFKSLQSLFMIIVTKLSQVYSIPHQQREMLKFIINQLHIDQENIKINENFLKMQCSWIDEMLKNIKDFKIEEVISQQFVHNFIKLTVYIHLKNPVQYEQSLQKSISILQKFIPRNFSQNQTELIHFGLGLLQLIIKCIQPNSSTKKIDYETVSSITSAVIMTRCPEFNNEIEVLLRILKQGSFKIGSLLCELVEKETQIASMEADIKGLFLKESQNLVDESQDKISVRLQTFINTFKIKYQGQVGSFSNITSKLVKKQIKKDEKKDIAYLCYDKSNSFCYSDVFKRDFSQYEPSNCIKLIIKDLLSGFNANLQRKNMANILDSLRDLFYYSPLIIPFVMLHPIETQSGPCDFVDLLVTIVSNKKNEHINKFLLFSCLDHSSLHKIKDRTIFFSEYLCFRIIKQILNQGINRHTLFVSYQLAQLKRFAYLCKVKLNRFEGKSLVSAVIDRLQSTREGFFYKTAENNIIYLLMAIIFKQDGIDNLKKCFIPKRPKEFDRDYKLINECLVPFNVYYRKQKMKGQLETREDNITFTGNLVTPFYAELYQQIYMEEDYVIETPSYHTEQMPLSTMDIQSSLLFFQSFKEKHLKSLISLKKPNKYKETEDQMKTEHNTKHQQTAAQINGTYFRDQQEEKSQKEDSFMMDSSDQDIIQLAIQQRQRRNRRATRGRRGAGNNRRNPPRGHMRNQRHVSRYAQQDFYNPGNQGQEKTLEAQFELSLNIIASEQVLQEKISTNFDEMKQHQEQIYSLLNEINQKLFLMGKQAIKQSELSEKSYQQSKHILQVKQAQIDFDYNKRWMSPQEFEQYMQMSATRFSKLDEARRDEVRHAEERMLSVNLQRSASSESINYIIDTIDQNIQHIHNIGRTLSRSSLSSNNEENIILPQQFHFQNNMLSYRVFSDVNEKILFEMLLSFYYTCQKFSTKQFMPFLENKRIQNQLINTLLYLMRDPFNRKYFPNCYFEFIDGEDQLRWREIEVSETNKDIEAKLFAERVMPIFQSVKNYSFYQNDVFLLQEISMQGILGIQYEPKYPNQHNNSYVPIKQILDYTFDMSARTTIELLKGTKSLPDHQIEKIIEKLVLSQKWQPDDEGPSAYLYTAGRHLRSPNRLTRDTTPYQNIIQLSKNPVFKEKFRAVYTYSIKDPSPALLTQLIQSQVYSHQQLKEMHMKMLENGQVDINSLIFFNKIVQIYTDQELEGASWLRQYQQIISKAIKCVRRAAAAKVEDEPILRILKLKNDLGFEIKRAIFEREISEKQALLNFEYEEVQKSNLICKKEKGIFLSTFEELRNKPDNFWLSPFSIRFINQNGIRQTGHGDGVRRQWFTLLSKEMVNPSYSLFSRTPTNYYFFNKESYINSRHLQYYEFIGKLFGYSLTKSSLLVSPSFSILLYKMILSEEITFEDILTQFKDERQHLQGIKIMIAQAKSEQDVSDCIFNFTYPDKRLISSVNYSILASKKVEGQDQILSKRVEKYETNENVVKELHTEEEQKNLPKQTKVVKVTDFLQLKPGGADIKVTLDNMHEYLDLTKKKIFELIVTSSKKKFQAFFQGFKRVINPKQLSRFNSQQLRQLVEGTSVIDIADIKKYTKNSDVDEKTVDLLWKALEKLSNVNRGIFLWNWIGVDKMPMEGAKIMGLSISSARGKYIKAHTCHKSLEIPKCQTEQQMQESVTIIINNLKTGKAFLED